MPLTLRVSSYQSQAMGVGATHVFDTAGSIGRAPDNDWVLPDPERFVSSRHVLVSFEAGVYVVTDSSTNGTLVNGQELPRGGRIQLNDGDQLTIGNYEIAVSVQTAAAGQPLPQQAASSAGANPAHFQGDSIGGDLGVDPLDFFADPGPTAESGPAPTSQNHAPAESEFFAPPPVKADPAPPPAGDFIPADWDQTGFSAPPAPDAQAGAPAQQFPPTDSAGSATMPPFAVGGAEPPVSAAPPAGAAPGALGPDQTPVPGAVPGTGPDTPPPAAMPSSQGLTGTIAATGPAAGGPAIPDDDSVAALLRAAGVDPTAIDARTAAQLGEVLRVVIEGLMDVLKARAAIKNEFRVPVTTLQAVENNPLKFSANAEDALFNLFSRRGQSYQEPVDAFREAFDDLRAHQVAIMAGLRAAFASLLGKFDPDRLEETFDKGLKRSALLDVINKTKYWDLYRDMHAELGDGDVAFRRLFGDEFAQAYEEQMQRLTALRNRS